MNKYKKMSEKKKKEIYTFYTNYWDRYKIPLSLNDMIDKLSTINPIFISYYNTDLLYKNFFHMINSKNINQLNFIIFFYTNGNSHVSYGHWVALNVNKINKTANFFDSYGGFVDENKKYISSKILKQTKQDIPTIGNFMNFINSIYGYDMYYNEIKYQSSDPEVATCGRYVIYFLKRLNNNVDSTVQDFQKNIGKIYFDLKKTPGYKNINYDEIICNLVK